MPTLGYTFFLHRPCEHVYAYLYICSRYVSREQFAFPRVGGKPEKRLSMSIRPTMQNLLTETWQLQFEIEQLKKKIAEKNKQISKFREETREIEKKRENECGEKPATGHKRHRGENKQRKRRRRRRKKRAQDAGVVGGGQGSTRSTRKRTGWEIFSDADDVVAPGGGKNR